MSGFDDYLNAAPAQAAPSFDAYLGAAPSVPASAAGSAGSAPIQTAAGQPPKGGFAQDLAAGGASPYGLQDLKQFGTGAAHGIGSLFNNAANFVERQAARVGIFPQTAAADTAAQAAADQQFAQSATPGEKASAIVAPMVLPMSGAMAPGNAVRAGIGALPGMGNTFGRVVGSLLGNATNGAILATGAPIDPNQAAGPQDAQHLATGAALGAALPGAFNMARAAGSSAYNVARPILNPKGYVGEQFAGQLGDQAATVADNIRNAPIFVPGSFPTTAQAGQNPMLVATEKAAANSLPGFKVNLAARENANNQARWDALNQVAGTPLDLANAQAARDTASTPLYNVAKQQDIPVDAPMSGLMARPAMQSAIDRAQKLADNTEAGPILQTTRIPNNMGGSATSVQTLTGNGAQAVKEALDAMLLPENTQKLSSKEIGAIQDTRSAYMAWLEGKSDAFRQARQTYAAMSPPVNTMQAGQQIAERLGGMGKALNSSGTPQMTAPGFSTALGQALKQQEFGIDPGAQQALEGIGQDLQRSTVSNSIGSPGSDTAYNIGANGWLARNLYGPTFGGASGLGKTVAALGTAAAGHPIAAGGLLLGGNRIGQMVGGRLNEQLGNLLLNPSDLLPYLDARAAGPVNATQQALRAALARQILPAAVGGVARGSLVNAP